MNIRQIQHGWDVFDADGDKVGDVSEVRGDYLVLSKGFLFTKELYVPASAIGRVEHDRVYLTVSKDQIEAQGWDRMPETGATTERRERATEREGGEHVQLREEELRARKEQVETGQVGIRKDVVAEERTMEVPVTREEAVVERRPVERRPADAPIGEGETARVPLREERVEVDKQPVVYEEVEIGKREVQETERVSDTVRREEARVERAGDVDVEGEEPRRR